MFIDSITRLHQVIRFLLSILVISLVPFYFLAQTPPTGKLFVPNKADQVKATQRFMESYNAALQRAEKDSPYRLQFASTLFDQAMTRSNAADRYIWLKKTAEFAAWGGDGNLALQAIDEIRRQYLADTDGLRIDVLRKTVSHTQDADESKLLAELVMLQVESSLEDDRFDVAEKLCAIAFDAAKNSKDLPLVSIVRKKTKGVAAVRLEFAKIKPFFERLKKNPTDDESNLQVGRYRCLYKGDWDNGLYFLAQGNDPVLRLQAQRDLIKPKNPVRQTELGNGWWDLSLNCEGHVKTHLRQRAVHWYEQSIHAAKGDEKKRLELRIASVPAARSMGRIPWDHSGPPGLIRILGRHTSTVYGVAFSPDGKTALSGSTNTRAAVWDTATGNKLHHLQGHGGMIWNVAYNSTGKNFFTASWDGSVKMWEAKTGREKRRFPAAGRIADINGIAVSKDGRRLMAGSDDSSIRLWDIKTGKLLKQLRGHRGFVYAVAFSPDGRRALSGGGSDRMLIYWNLQTGKAIRQFNIPGSIRSVAFSPDGRKAVAAGEVNVRLWDLVKGTEIRRFQGHTSTVYAVAFSPDGKRLVTAGADRTVRYWDVETGKQLHQFTGHTSTIYSVAISPGGGRVVTGGGDNTIRLWGLPR